MDSHQCLSAVIPFRTSSNFGTMARISQTSPMPFGSHPFQDPFIGGDTTNCVPRHQCLSAVIRFRTGGAASCSQWSATVTNAFRQSSVSGPSDTAWEASDAARHQCLSAVIRFRTANLKSGNGFSSQGVTNAFRQSSVSGPAGHGCDFRND